MNDTWDTSLELSIGEEDKSSLSERKRKRDTTWELLESPLPHFSGLGDSVDSISDDVEEENMVGSPKKMRINSKNGYDTGSESELEEEEPRVSPPILEETQKDVFLVDVNSSLVDATTENPLLNLCGDIISNVRTACQNETLYQLLHQSGLHKDLSSLLERVQAVCDFHMFTKNHTVAPFSLSLGNFYALPPELLYHLFSFFEPKEVCLMRSVCREFYSIGTREELWRSLCVKKCFIVNNKLTEKYNKGWEFIYKSKAVNLLNTSWPENKQVVGYVQRNDKQIRCEGEWCDGRLYGYGIEISLANGSTREGEWKNGTMNGYGIWTRKDKTGEDVYKGMWVDDQREGHGLMVYNHGRRYEGEWLKGKRHGKGETHNNGREYNGELQDGKIHGFGEMKYTDGRKYVGSWVRASRQGKGVMTYADGRVYTGEWWKGKRHGKGKLVYTDGSFYTGDWQKNHRQGTGSMVYATGKARYEGEWMKSTMHGKGTLIFPDGGIYQGDWVQGQMDGFGIMFYVNGAVYEGSWKANQRHGNGKMLYANGGLFEGKFKMGLEVRESVWN